MGNVQGNKDFYSAVKNGDIDSMTALVKGGEAPDDVLDTIQSEIDKKLSGCSDVRDLKKLAELRGMLSAKSGRADNIARYAETAMQKQKIAAHCTCGRV